MGKELAALSVEIVEAALRAAAPVSSFAGRVGLAQLAGAFRQFRTSSQTIAAVAARLTEAAESIAERLQTHTDRDFHKLGHTDGIATIDGVSAALERVPAAAARAPGPLTTDRLLQMCGPTAERVWNDAELSPEAISYGRVYLSHACDYVVALATGLLEFDSHVSVERYVLVRRLEEILHTNIATVVEPFAPTGNPQDFNTAEASHRTDIARRYQTIDLFGLGLPAEMRRQRIEVAYTHLRSSFPKAMNGDKLARHARDIRRDVDESLHSDWRAPVVKTLSSSVMVDESLADTLVHGGSRERAGGVQYLGKERVQRQGGRFVLVGGAGSGKTTISQWLAVRAATTKLPRVLRSALGQCVPFYVPLRNLQKRTSEPVVEDLILDDRPELRTVAGRWIRDKLRDGRALVILDGFDELSESFKPGVQSWLDDLLKDYHASHFCVTSRPEGLHRQWFAERHFELIELQAMEPEQARECIINWYTALIEGGAPDKRREYESYREKLLTDFENRPTVKDLAQTPLLCAMLCALYAIDTIESVPQTRMDLYSRVVEALVDRRDRERLVSYDDIADFSGREKMQLLQAIARRMSEAGEASIQIWRKGSPIGRGTTAIEAVEQRLHSMPTAAVTANQALAHLVDRCVVFRDTGSNDGQFVHRTFQEYLAGRDYAYVGDIDAIVDQAANPTLRNTIVFAAGSASQRVAGDIVYGLADLAHGDGVNGRDILLLMAECVGAAGPLHPDAARLASDHVAAIFPPTSIAEADAIAGFGDHLTAWLGRYEVTDVAVQRACIHVLSRVGTPRALSVLSAYSKLPVANAAVDDFVGAWARFDPMSYGRQVLANLDLGTTPVTVTTTEMLRGIAHAGTLRSLTVKTPISDLRELGNLAGLTELQAPGMITNSIDGIERLRGLERLDLRRNRAIPSVAGIGRLHRLQALYLDGCESLDDLSEVGTLARLRVLSANTLSDVGDWAFLEDVRALRTLWIDGCTPAPLAHLGPLGELRSLFADVRGGAADTTALANCHNLWRLKIRLLAGNTEPTLDLPRSITSLHLIGDITSTTIAYLAGLPDLRKLTITNANRLQSCAAFEELTGLEELTIHDARSIQDWAGLRTLTGLRSLDLSGCSVRTMDFTASMTRLQVVSLDRCKHLEDLEGLERSRALRLVNLRDGVNALNAWKVDDLRAASMTRESDLDVVYDPGQWDYGVS